MKQILTLLTLPSMLLAAQNDFFMQPKQAPTPPPTPTGIPWFTGPLITPSANVVPRGSYNVEPYIYMFAYTAAYQKDWSVEGTPNIYALTLQCPSIVGLTPWMDISFVPTVSWQWCKNKYNMEMNDFIINLDFAPYTAPPGSWTPNVRLTVGETFPTGRYRHLGPNELGTDVGGKGSFQQNAEIMIGQTYHIQGESWWDYRLGVIFNYFVPVHVKGFNTYGGGSKCDGTVYPGSLLTSALGVEVGLDYHWALACDFVAQWTARDRFVGNDGFAEGDKKVPNRFRSTHHAVVGQGSQFVFTVAPALEYNWNEVWGIVFGSWMTVAGKSTPVFYSGIFALDINIGL